MFRIQGRELKFWSLLARFDWRREAFLIFLTGVFGVAGEIFFYTLIKCGRLLPVVGDLFFSFDWQPDARLNLGQIWNLPIPVLYGQCSLWMFPVYAGATLYIVRPLYISLRGFPFWWRAILYGAGITVFEGLCGIFYENALGFSVWTYKDAGVFFGDATSIRILPLWCLVGLFTEILLREMNHPAWREALKKRFKNDYALAAQNSSNAQPGKTILLEKTPGVWEVRAAIPQSCFQISEWRAFFTVFQNLILGILGVFIILKWRECLLTGSLGEIPIAILTLPACWLLGQVYVGWFVIGHDCGHNSFSRKTWINTVVGHFCTGFIGLSFEGWRAAHNCHHANTQMRGFDPDWAENQLTEEEFDKSSLLKKAQYILAYATPVGMLVGIWHGNLRKNFLPWGYPQIRLQKNQTFKVLFGTGCGALQVSALCYAFYVLGGVWAIVFCYLIPCFFGGISGTLLTFLHHTRHSALVYEPENWNASQAQIAATYEVRFPPLLEWLWRDINIHLPHHVAPRIPWYRLKKASASIHEKFTDSVNSPTEFQFRLLTDVWHQPFLETVESAEKNNSG